MAWQTTGMAMSGGKFAGFVSALPHPGEHLREDYLPGYGLTVGRLAALIGVDRRRVARVVRGSGR